MNTSDRHSIQKIIAQVADADSSEFFEGLVIELLENLFPHSIVGWDDWSSDRTSLQNLYSSTPMAEFLDKPGHFEALTHSLPDHPVIAASGWSVVEKEPALLSDFCSFNALQHTSLYSEFYRPLGIRDQLAYSLPPLTHRAVVITVNREGGYYTTREKNILFHLGRALGQVLRQKESTAYLQNTLERLTGIIGGRTKLVGLETLTSAEVTTMGTVFRSKNIVEAAQQLGIKRNTLDHRLSSLREKVGLESTPQLRAALRELVHSSESTT